MSLHGHAKRALLGVGSETAKGEKGERGREVGDGGNPKEACYCKYISGRDDARQVLPFLEWQ